MSELINLIYALTLKEKKEKKKKNFLFWLRKPQNESVCKPPNKADSFKKN